MCGISVGSIAGYFGLWKVLILLVVYDLGRNAWEYLNKVEK